MKAPILELDFTASAIDIGISHLESRQSSSKTGAFDSNSA
jgi:hypothetical protein